MNEGIKCPQCGGNKIQWTGDICKCMYCGTVFKPIIDNPDPTPQQPVPQTAKNAPLNPSSNVNVTVNVPNTGNGYNNGGYDNRRNENSFSKGAAQGAGAAAGGCLATTGMIIAIPIILFLALLSMCSSSI